MKVQLLSDLHLEHCRGVSGQELAELVPEVTGDVLVLAGDISTGTCGLLEYGGLDVPTVYICGNHELYQSNMNLMMTELRQCAGSVGIHFLENSSAIVDGVRFLGATLWTDFALYPGQDGRSMNTARAQIADFSRIRNLTGFFRPEDSINIHRESRRWLKQALEEPFDGPTVVVTHHAPSGQSVNPRFEGDPLNPAFASELSDLAGLADVWVHGHMHDSCDYDWGGTRVICNPRGYPLRLDGQRDMWENAQFDPAFLFEV